MTHRPPAEALAKARDGTPPRNLRAMYYHPSSPPGLQQGTEKALTGSAHPS